MGIHINPLYFTSVIILWIVTYHVAYWLVALARDSSLVFWSVGPFGISVVSLREPPARRILAQLGVAAGALTVVAYTSLFVVNPPPIAGLGRGASAQAVAVAIPVAVVTVARLIAIVRDRRYPLWGEARVLTSAQRSLATRARIYFTPTGRAFLRDRFGATPNEFLRMVR